MSREEQQEPQVMGPGQILKSARLSANLTVKDIALKIHLKSIMIEDLEADKYDSNISLTFIKGYIKLYAKQVLVPEAEIMEAFESINTQKKEPAKLQSFSRRVANQANDDKLMLVTYFILAVVFALVVIWWFQQGENDDTVGASTLSQSTDVQDSVKGIVNQSAEDLGADEQGEALSNHLIKEVTSITGDNDPQHLNVEPNIAGLNSTINNATDLASQEPTAVVQASARDIALASASAEDPPSTLDEQQDSAVEQTLAADNPSAEETQQALSESTQLQMAESVELVFTFSEDCWMNLSDATGENIAYGVKASGRVMTVSGLPPFIITLGAPQVVQINYAGEAVDMSVFKAGNTAKFTLPLTG